MTQSGLDWHLIATKGAARELQGFTCTSDHPRTPRGRRLPHPRPWEWEAQRHLRSAAQHLRDRDALHVGRNSVGAIASAAHVAHDEHSGLLVANIQALGVGLSYRARGGDTADEAFATIRDGAKLEAGLRRCSTVILTGKVHRLNLASQYACLRAGLEPADEPITDYQTWALCIRL